jgi:hypothetical protein
MAGLLLICPRCHAKVPIDSQTCSHCGADLKDLPLEQRRYIIDRLKEVEAAPLHPVIIPEAVEEILPEPEFTPEALAKAPPTPKVRPEIIEEAALEMEIIPEVIPEITPVKEVPLISGPPLEEREHLSLCEALDRILNKGAVVVGEATISVANIDLLYLGMQLVLTSIETAREIGSPKANL